MIRRAVGSIVILWIVLPGLAAAQDQQPPRDAALRAGSGIVRGKVLSAAGRQPLHRVRITLLGQAQNPPTAVTNVRGEFEIIDVPSGTYRVSASRSGYLPLEFGQRLPRERGRPVHVEAGRAIEGIDIILEKSGVIAGRISDDQGDPAPGARVEAVESRYLNGRRLWVPAGIATTNDLGEFRVAGLPPGAYILRASSEEAWDSDDFSSTFVLAETYYPGVTATESPVNITLAGGQEVSDIDLRLIAGRAARVTGRVEDAAGAPLAAQEVHMSRITRTIGGALLSSGPGPSTRTNADGRFAFERLAPGEFLVITGGPSAMATEGVMLAAGDNKQLLLSPRRQTRLSGTVVVHGTEGGKPAPFPPGRLRVLPIDLAADPLPGWGAPSETTLGADWTFRLTNVGGNYLFRLRNLPDDWMVKSVLFGGQDVTDVPVPVTAGAADIDGVQVIITPVTAKIRGTVMTADEKAIPDATVIVFAADRGRWGTGSRFIKAVRPDASGKFTAAGLPEGVYHVIARDLVPDGQWEDPEFLQSLIREATRVEVGIETPAEIKLVMETRR